MFITQRPTVEAVERFIGLEIPVLDHGYIKLWDYMGDDESIARAARTSYQKGTKTKIDDAGLLKYLLEHKHTTPFEMCEIKVEMKLPLFVARQLIRHRTANVNEMSARYSILEKEFYLPETANMQHQSKSNKQGREGVLNDEYASLAQLKIEEISDNSYEAYEYLLAEDAEGNDIDGLGLARELSRMVLPVNFYTRWVWKIDLHNLFNFLRLRMDSHAQYEIRVYADAIYEIVKAWVPDAVVAFDNAVWRARTFTAEEMEIIRDIFQFSNIGVANLPSAWSDRRKNDFMKKVQA